MSKFSSFFKSLLTSITAFLPLAALFGVKMSPELQAAQAVAPILFPLIDAVEASMGDGTGVDKKAVVQATVKAFVGKMAEVSTGGQKETYTSLNTLDIGAMIDAIVGMANAATGKTTVP
jgi:hypothetical protein